MWAKINLLIIGDGHHKKNLINKTKYYKNIKIINKEFFLLKHLKIIIMDKTNKK